MNITNHVTVEMADSLTDNPKVTTITDIKLKADAYRQKGFGYIKMGSSILDEQYHSLTSFITNIFHIFKHEKEIKDISPCYKHGYRPNSIIKIIIYSNDIKQWLDKQDPETEALFMGTIIENLYDFDQPYDTADSNINVFPYRHIDILILPEDESADN